MQKIGSRTAWLSALPVALAFLASCYSFPEPTAQPNLKAGLSAGFAGAGNELEVRGYAEEELPSRGSRGLDMALTPGGFVHFEVPASPNISSGARVYYGSFITQRRAAQGWSRNHLVAGELVYRFHTEFIGPIDDIYLLPSFGFVIPFPSEEWKASSGIDGPGGGLTMGLLVGGEHVFDNGLGLFSEAGIVGRGVVFPHEDDTDDTPVRVNGSFYQFTVNVGVSYFFL